MAMRITVIGGTGLIGPHVVRQLSGLGHDLTLINRRGVAPEGCSIQRGDRRDPSFLTRALKQASPEIIIDMIPFCRRDMADLVQAAGGMVRALVLISSIDVYLAYGRLHRSELGTPIPTPLTEDSPLRSTLSFQGEAYDKLSVENISLNSEIPTITVLRLPMVYGPPDRSRMESYVSKMRDGRRVIPLRADYARWCVARSHVENCAEAVTLAAGRTTGGHCIYNVAEATAYTEQAWVETIGRSLDWDGKVVAIDDPRLAVPFDIDTAQDFAIDSRRIRSELGFTEVISPGKAVIETARWIAQNVTSRSANLDAEYAAEDIVMSDHAR